MVELKRLLKSVASAALLAASLSSCGYFVYHAEDIEGWVVDAETGQPLEGVIVVANWELEGGMEGGVPIDQLQILEAVTDRNGRYYFPKWGPKVALFGRLETLSPGLLFFKRGYKYLGLDNRPYAGMDTTQSDWDGETVKLERFKGALAQYAIDLRSLSSTLERVGHTGGEPCGWREFPRMLRSLDQLEREFRRAGAVEGTVVSFLRANDEALRNSGCGSVFDDLVDKE